MTILAALAQFIPPDRLLMQSGQLVPYESDGLTAYHARPAAVVMAETQAEVIQTVRLSHQHQAPFVARGSGTSLSAGLLPVQDGIVIALTRLHSSLRLDPQYPLAVVKH